MEAETMTIRAALILAVALILAAFAHGGVYGMVAAGAAEPGIAAFRFNRFTGNVLVSCL